MNSLIALLIRHGLAGCAGFFAAHNISGDSTTSLITGLLMLSIVTGWSWLARALKIEDAKPGFDMITHNEIVRTFIASLVSQLVTFLSAYFATDANNPELLGVAVINAGLSKVGAHQKLAFMGSKDALKLLFFVPCASFLVSCDTIRTFALNNRATIEEVIVYGVRQGVNAGFKKFDAESSKASRDGGKQPRDVQPTSNRPSHP